MLWPAHLLPSFPHRDTRPCEPTIIHTLPPPLNAQQLYGVAAALLADGPESFVHHHSPVAITGGNQGPQHDVPHMWRETLRGRTRIKGADCTVPPPGPGEALVVQAAGYQAILSGVASGFCSHVLADGKWSIWHNNIKQGACPPHTDCHRAPI